MARHFLAGLGLGAAAAYFFDPQWGRRRRAVCRDRLTRLARETADAAVVATRDAGHRARGLWAETVSAAGNAPSQGRPEGMQENWSPALRAASVAAGAGLVANCLARHTPLATLGGTAGFALVLRGLTNAPVGRLVGVTGGRRAVDVQKALTIAGPVERVYPFFARYDTFPRFMRNIQEVRDLGDGRSHWVARGPAGLPVSWDAVETAREPNRLLAWKSESGSLVRNAGVIRFEPAGEDTRVTIRFSYNPPGGTLGHVAALLFGADPKGLMDEDLLRLKGLIETGQAAVPGKGEVTRQDVTEGAAVPAA